MATEYETVTTNIVENVTLNEDNCLEKNNTANNKDSSIDQSFLSLNPSQEALLQILRPMFQRNYETIKNQSIGEKDYSTKCNKKLSDDVTKVIDFLANNAIKELDNSELFDINALLYTSAITAKEYVNDLKELSKKRPKKSLPKWLNKSKIKSLC